MLVGILGILKAGVVYVPLDPSLPTERLNFILEDTQVSFILTQQRLLESIPSHQCQMICLDRDWSQIQTQKTENPSIKTSSNELAYIMYTSGSTGQPKGVKITHRGVVRLVKDTYYAEFSPDEVFLQLAPFAFDASTFEIWGCLLNGAKLVVFPSHTPSLEELGEVIEQSQITTLWLTAGLFHLIVDTRLEYLKPIRQLLAGGDALSVPHVQKVLNELPNCQLINGYGPTENTTFTCCYPIKQLPPSSKSVPIGRPIANTQVYILDPEQKPVSIGIAGEVYVGGDGLAQGYLNRLDLTEEKFIPNPFSDDKEARLYKTGDLGRYLPDGNIEFLGRLDDQVKIRGFRIELGEIETSLAQHPSVQQTVVIAREDNPDNKRLVAYIVPHPEQALTIEELRRFLKQKLPEYMIPSAFVVLDTLPLTPNGKIDRRALPAPEQIQPKPTQIFVAPRDEIELQMTQIWEEVLGIHPIGVRDNFFDIGGHSLLAVRLFAKIEKAFGKNIPLAALFQNPTIEQLTSAIRQEKKITSWSSLGPIHPENYQPPLNQNSKGWSAPYSNSLVLLQPRGSKNPLFFLHGVGGNTLRNHILTRLLGSDRPLYGFQARGSDGIQSPRTQIEDMAASYIKEMQTVQPEGPYFLAGFCFGGLVAYEMAVQLEAQGQKVLLLAMLEAFYPKLTGQNSSKTARDRVLYHLNNLTQTGFQGKIAYVLGKTKDRGNRIKEQIMKRLKNIACNFYVSQGWTLPHSLRHYRLLEIHSQASDNYVPQSYPGKVTLFRCTQQHPRFAHQPLLGWEEVAEGGVELQEIEGFHDRMLREPTVQVLAQKLKECLDRAQAEIDNVDRP